MTEKEEIELNMPQEHNHVLKHAKYKVSDKSQAAFDSLSAPSGPITLTKKKKATSGA